MQTVVIKKDETIQIVVETLEAYPVPVSWNDARNVAANKIMQDIQAENQAKALAAQAAAQAAANAPKVTHVQQPDAVDPANNVG